MHKQIIISILIGCIHFNKALTLDDVCETPTREHGLCIFYDECPLIYQLIDTPVISNDQKQFVKSSRCGYTNGKPLVCCATAFPVPRICGRTIVHDRVANQTPRLDEYPWMALLQYTNLRGEQAFLCTGSLITDQYVLTAAHCVIIQINLTEQRLLSVRLGEYDLTTSQDCQNDDCSDPPVDVQIAKIISHERYAPLSPNQENDIALVLLRQRVRFTKWISPICLPWARELRSLLFENEQLVLAGYGLLRNQKLGNSKRKMDQISIVVSNELCRGFSKLQNRTIKESQLCAGGVRANDSCFADSGSPLMAEYREPLEQSAYAFLVGIVSYGHRTVNDQYSGTTAPAVYTRATAYLDWIASNVK